MDIFDGMVSAGGHLVPSRRTMASKFYWAKRMTGAGKLVAERAQRAKTSKSPQLRDFHAPALAVGKVRKPPRLPIFQTVRKNY
jgi:hypothetical protein